MTLNVKGNQTQKQMPGYQNYKIQDHPLVTFLPFCRAEEKCLVRSGLVHLLDRLCSLANHRGDVSLETQSTRQKVSAMAWAGFQVLADRCVMWETEEGGLTYFDNVF